MPTGTDVVHDLIRRFEGLPSKQRIAQAPAARARLAQLPLSDSAKAELWRGCFVPLVHKAEADLAERAAAVAENAGAVVLRGAVELAERFPGKLDPPTAAQILVGTSDLGTMTHLHGIAEGVPEESVVALVEQLVGKGVLHQDARGRLARAAKAS